MAPISPGSNLAMFSVLQASGDFEIFLDRLAVPTPADKEVLVQILAAPVNPSDTLLMFESADPGKAEAFVRGDLPALRAKVAAETLPSLEGRIGDVLPVGNEASGRVIMAGSAPEAQALLGKKVALVGGAMYAEYRCSPAGACLALPDDFDVRDGASSFVNPMTAMGFLETARREGHRAIVHTAAASNLGLMLNRLCVADGIPLVNIVRSKEQADLLRREGATYALNSSDPDFGDQLADAIAETGSTIIFDAIAGGSLGARVLSAMELNAARKMAEYSRYGSETLKQLYVYGRLDTSPIQLTHDYGFRWSVAGWLLTHFLDSASGDLVAKMRARVASELTTTFASGYSHEITLEQALDPAVVAAYVARRTGEKYLITPHPAELGGRARLPDR